MMLVSSEDTKFEAAKLLLLEAWGQASPSRDGGELSSRPEVPVCPAQKSCELGVHSGQGGKECDEEGGSSEGHFGFLSITV